LVVPEWPGRRGIDTPVGEDDEFIDVFGAKVLPQLNSP